MGSHTTKEWAIMNSLSEQEIKLVTESAKESLENLEEFYEEASLIRFKIKE